MYGTYEYRCLWKAGEGTGLPVARAIDVYYRPNMGAGNQTLPSSASVLPSLHLDRSTQSRSLWNICASLNCTQMKIIHSLRICPISSVC